MGDPMTTRSRDRNQIIECLGRHQLVEALVVLLPGQPAFGVRGAEQGGHLLAVGIGARKWPPALGPTFVGSGTASVITPS